MSGTVTAAGVITSVVALAVGVAGVGAHVADSHRAQVAADLAAVAGATAHYQGNSACDTARRTAELNHAVLEACSLIDGDVTVTTATRTSTARARAGPG